MQDFRSMMSGVGGGGGGGGRIFGGERRLRPFPNQALKCPRCDSLNTKFCYYNNYNLSQPRHFCKSCRRYWTKGGVLRNVPVGGGCRKTKRSKPKTSSTGDNEKTEKKSTTSHSSSDSSSLTATTTTEVASSNSAAATTTLVNFPESTTTTSAILSQNVNPNPNFEASMMMQLKSNSSLDQGTESGMFPETSGGFTGLMNGSNNNSPFLGFNFSEISPFRLNHQEQDIQMQQQKMVEELKFQELTKGILYGGDHQTVIPVDMHGLTNRMTTSNGGLTALDWQQQQSSNGIGGVDDHQGLFDLPNSSTVVVDHQSYWSQTSQWTENDHSLYLP